MFGDQLSNKWLSAHICIEVIKISSSNTPDVASGLDPGKFNKAMSASKIWGHAMQYYDSTNATGVLPLKHAQQFYYMITKQGEQVKYPVSLGKVWTKEVEEREANLFYHTHSMDEEALDDMDVHTKLPNPVQEMKIHTDKTQMTSCQLSVQTYWDSLKAQNLFRSQTGDENAILMLN